MFKFILFLILIIAAISIFTYRYYRIKQEEERKEILYNNQLKIIKTGVLMQINVERSSCVDVNAIEQLWRYFSAIAEVDNEDYNPYLSFEIMAERDDYKKIDEIVFNLWIPKRFENMFVTRLRTVYPTITIKRLENDYIPDINDKSRVYAMANMGLSRHYVYSLKTIDSIKDTDPLETIINSVSSLDTREKTVVQIFLKPINDEWKEEAKDYLDTFELNSITPESKNAVPKSKFKTYLKVFLSLPYLILTKPKDEVKEKIDEYFNGEVIDKGTIEKSQIKNITDKVSSVGYCVDIRILVSTPYGSKTAENRIDQICGAFKEIDGDNKLVKKEVSDRKEFMHCMKSRWYPLEKDNDILSTKEISMFCHLPNESTNVAIKKITTKYVDAPVGLSNENAIGTALRSGKNVDVGIDSVSRFRHMWILGQTGTGKSTLLENMILNDIENNKGLMFIDPHGDSAISIIERCSTKRNDIYYLDVSDIMNPPGINLFEMFNTDYSLREQEKNQIVENFIIVFTRIFGRGAIGPNTEDILRNAAYAIMENPEGASLLDIYLMLTSSAYRKYLMNYLNDKPPLKGYWEENFEKLSKDLRYQQQNLNAPLNKLRRFINDPTLADIMCPKKSTINVKQIMDTGGVILVNMSKGKLGELTSNVIGSILVSQVQIATMMRTGLPKYKMTPFFLYIDEFENFIGGEGGGKAFESILSEARKYNLGMIIANQYMNQLQGENGDMKSAIIGNVGTECVYRLGNQDAKELASEFENGGKGFKEDDLENLGKYTMAARIMNDSIKSEPFTVFVNAPKEKDKTANPKYIIQYSKELLTRKRESAQLEILERMKKYKDETFQKM